MTISENRSSKRVYALVLKLIAGRDFYAKDYSHGRLIHAAFLDIIRTIDPMLSERLHDLNQRKPYTLSPIWSSQPQIRMGAEAYLRVCFLDVSIAELFVEQFILASRNQTFSVGKTSFAIVDVLATPDQHPQAGALDITPPTQFFDVNRVELNLLTPTAFSRKQGTKVAYETSMTPRLVWHYARRIWESIGGESPGPAFDDWCEAHTAIESVNTKPRTVDFGRFKVKGVIGKLRYVLHAPLDDEMRLWWFQFARFMPFSSLGYKTTMGMGQCSTRFLDF
ncbi:MAG: hypothetical protein CUN55_09635 [Phototrophicales bacterium]|nr:MAG: hypothetical protein CUN55_09635 [Phototrophicales bacterium]